MLRLVVLISGSGTNLGALLEAADEPGFPARVVAVGADVEADGLALAEERGIPSFVVPYSSYPSREAWGEALAAELDVWQPDLVVLSGLMRLLPHAVVTRYAPRILNTHPAFLPEFPGAHGVRDALAAGAAQTGASVIVVDSGVLSATDAKVDAGPILAQERVAIEPGDTESTLHARIKPVERRLLAQVIRDIATGAIDLHHPPTP